MIKTEPIIAAHDAEKSSLWYQQLSGCIGQHGGSFFEILANEQSQQILSLHKWSEHEHLTFTTPENAGNGLILYFLVDDINQIWDSAQKLKANIESEPKVNPNSGRMEFSVRDIDNYYISIRSETSK